MNDKKRDESPFDLGYAVKWEYRWIDLNMLNMSDYTANQLGRDGWELVSVDNGTAYFKRLFLEDRPIVPSGYVHADQIEEMVIQIVSRELGRELGKKR